MKKRSKKNNKLLIILFIFLFIILYFIMTNNTLLDNFKGISASIFNFRKTTNSNNINNAEIEDLKKEINNLKKINDLDKLLTDKVKINASVIKRSMPYWHNNITINKGKKDNIKKGYAVINSGGLVGEIDVVNKNSSEVKLITNNDNNYISAKFLYKEKEYYGIIKKYNIITNELYLENVIGELNDDIKGINVVTSGLSSNIPSGLYIGSIKRIKKDKYNLSNVIIINLGADINDLTIVKVVGNND
ncbi:MAG: rod shape-determining protein MreC [Bacilli bacterium]|nr:rod shape-determining protein MreC [Bacilli bacterium]